MAKFDIRYGRDDFREERSVAGIFWFFKHCKEIKQAFQEVSFYLSQQKYTQLGVGLFFKHETLAMSYFNTVHCLTV